MSQIRTLLLALVVIGTIGLLLELILLEHYADPWQWAPMVVLGVGLSASVMLAMRPSRGTVLAFRAVMAVFVLTAVIGLGLHYFGNAEFELELNEALSGTALVWSALRGATPVLAPGALAQLGLLGLILSYDHPALTRRGSIGLPTSG